MRHNGLMASNSMYARLLRTILSGVISVLIANADFIVESLNFSGGEKAIIVALVMAVLSPVMKVLGGDDIREKAYDDETIELRDDIEVK